MNEHSVIYNSKIVEKCSKGGITTMARHLDEEKKINILTAALEQFGDKGFKSTTIKDIAVSAEVAPGSIYTYFNDKEALFRATVEAGWHEFNAEMQRIISLPGAYKEKLDKVIRFGFDLLKKLYPILRGMLSEAARLNLLQKNINHLCKSLESLFTKIQSSGAIIPVPLSPEQGEYLLNIVVSGILFHISMVPPEELDEEIDRMKKTVLDGVMRFLTEQPETVEQEGKV